MLMKRAFVASVVLSCGVCLVAGEQYFVSYDADGVYPEDRGWTRSVYGGGAQRWFDNGSLVIDSRASTGIEDAYIMQKSGQLDPSSPNEWFFMSWRMRTDELQGPWDAAVGAFSDERRAVFLDFSLDHISIGGIGTVATFEPGVFHGFELRSSNMLTYDLYVDGALAHSGNFTVPLLTASTVGWGDMTSGGASLTRWEYFRFGVVPEPKSALVGVTLLAAARAVSRGKSP